MVQPAVLADGAMRDISDVGFISICNPRALGIGLPREYGVLVLTPEGEETRRIGRRGSGPGEFSDQLGRIPMCRGDSMVVADDGQRRLTVFSPAGKYVRTQLWPQGLLAQGEEKGAPIVQLVPRAVLVNGTVLAGMRPGRDADFRVAVLIVDDKGQLSRKVVEYDFGAKDCSVATRTGIPTMVPFCAVAASAVSQDGAFVAVVSATPAQQDRGAIRLQLIPTGDAARGFDREILVQADVVTPEAFEAEIRRLRLTNDRTTALRSQPPRERYPHTLNVMVASDGTTWIEHLATNARLWTVVGRDGMTRRELHVPADVRLLAVTTKAAFGVQGIRGDFESIVRVDLQGKP